MRNPVKGGGYDIVIFDMLSARIDRWTVWNDGAGSDENGGAKLISG